MNTVFLKGLETDERLFESQIKRFSGFCLPWLAPDKNDSLKDYSKRVANEISSMFHTPVNIVGHCFGGVVAMEVAQHIELNSVVVLNAPGDSNDIQDDFRKGVKVGSKMPLTMLRSLLAMKAPSFYKEKEKLNEEQFKIVESMIRSLDIHFLKWAAVASADWNQTKPLEFSCPKLSVHGSENKIIKRPKNMDFETLDGAGHLMAMTHPEELSTRLEQFWKKIPSR